MTAVLELTVAIREDEGFPDRPHDSPIPACRDAVRRARLQDASAGDDVDGPLAPDVAPRVQGPSLVAQCWKGLCWLLRRARTALVAGMVAEGVVALVALLGALAGLPPVVVLFLVALVGLIANTAVAVVTFWPVLRQCLRAVTRAA